MPDRKKVMSWLEGLAQEDWRMFHSDSEVQFIAESALTLLKEQEECIPISYLKELQEAYPNSNLDDAISEILDYWTE